MRLFQRDNSFEFQYRDYWIKSPLLSKKIMLRQNPLLKVSYLGFHDENWPKIKPICYCMCLLESLSKNKFEYSYTYLLRPIQASPKQRSGRVPHQPAPHLARTTCIGLLCPGSLVSLCFQLLHSGCFQLIGELLSWSLWNLLWKPFLI